MHMMAFEFLGGRAHCGRPWHRFGAEYALVDCPDHYAMASPLESAVSSGAPGPTHDPVGWPTFKDWPHHESLTHEQSYYRWLERAWMGGLRVYVNLFVENKVLCELYPLKQNSCDEMDSVRLQNKRIHELENYIDAQSGGPGEGWFRIVTDPFQARRVINQGKLAVILGIEVSEPFGCKVYNDEPQCDRAQIDRELNEVYGFGVRQMELVNKFDNALVGVAGDAGSTGTVVNSGNRYETGRYWDMQACTGPPEETDKESPGVYDHDHNDVFSNVLEAFLPPGAAPVYPRGAQCNSRGLTDLGEHAVRRMIGRGMIIDPDHMSVVARKQTMAVLEAERHGGVVSSHTWSSPDVIPRIYNLGGLVTPYAGSTKGFVDAWRKTKPKRNKRFVFGFGRGADMNGFGSQGGPRNGPNPVRYPFKSPDGKVTLERQTSGSRVFDINKDGVAHYGLYPDWLEDLRMLAGDEIVNDMARGAEAYLQMWERSVGVPAAPALPPRAGTTHGQGPVARTPRAGPGGAAQARRPAHHSQGSHLPLLRARQGQRQGEDRRRVRRQREGRTGWHHRARPPVPDDQAGGRGQAPSRGQAAGPGPARAPRQGGQALRVRRAPRQGALRRGHHALGGQEQEAPQRAPAPRRPELTPQTRAAPSSAEKRKRSSRALKPGVRCTARPAPGSRSRAAPRRSASASHSASRAASWSPESTIAFRPAAAIAETSTPSAGGGGSISVSERISSGARAASRMRPLAPDA